jgi:hypothetical protein
VHQVSDGGYKWVAIRRRDGSPSHDIFRKPAVSTGTTSHNNRHRAVHRKENNGGKCDRGALLGGLQVVIPFTVPYKLSDAEAELYREVTNNRCCASKR